MIFRGDNRCIGGWFYRADLDVCMGARFMARPENTSTDAEVKEMDGQKRADGTHLVKERGYGANYGLTLGVLSCVLFLCGLHRSFWLW